MPENDNRVDETNPINREIILKHRILRDLEKQKCRLENEMQTLVLRLNSLNFDIAGVCEVIKKLEE